MKTLIIIIFSSMLVAGIYFLHQCIFKRRALYSRDDMLRDYGVADKDYELLVHILSVIGRCYRIDYRKLRPTDVFDGNLSHLDSWVLDEGTEKLLDSLQDLGVTKLDKEVHTIKELVDVFLYNADKGLSGSGNLPAALQEGCKGCTWNMEN